MGRARLEIMYREDRRARIATYWSRMKGVKKKARELSTLCGVEVLLASFSPEIQALHIWPEDIPSFRLIAERYSRTCGPSIDVRPPVLCSPSPPPPSKILEEIHSMTRTLEEVNERVFYLEALEPAGSDHLLIPEDAAVFLESGDDEISSLLNMDLEELFFRDTTTDGSPVDF